MKPFNYILSAAAIAGIVGLGVGLGLKDSHPAAILDARVPVESLRVATWKGTCPATSEKCPGGMIQIHDRCLCYTDDVSNLTGELTELSASVGDLKKLIVCHESVDEQMVFRSRYIAQETVTPKDCVMVAEKLPHIVSTGINGALETQLATACTPCAVSPRSWGVCPYCVHPDYHQTCAEACPAAEEIH